MPILEKEIDVTVSGATIKDNFKVLDGTDTAHYFSFYRELTEAFNTALFEAFDEINETGILSITHKQSYDRKPVNEDACSIASFTVFGCEFNVFMYEMYQGTSTYEANPYYYCPRVAIVRQFATVPQTDATIFFNTKSSPSAGSFVTSMSKITRYKDRNSLCFRLVINYNEDFIDISAKVTGANYNTVTANGKIIPIFQAIKCQSITYRDAVYYSISCNLDAGTYHRLVFIDDIKNTYLGNVNHIQLSSTRTIDNYLFLQIDVSNTHFTNLLQADNTRLELYKPICCTGFIQFSDNIMCPFDDTKITPGEYYNVNDRLYYCPGSDISKSGLANLILRVE